jgi:hypothetical protein
MQMEENAGLGFGLTFLFGISVLAVAVRRGKILAPWEIFWPAAVRWASVLAFLALLTQSNVSAIGRLFSAYYILPLTLFLAVAGHETLVRRRWWRGLAYLVLVMAAGLLVISPARPLFPRDRLLTLIEPQAAAHPWLERVRMVYSVYRDRPVAFAPVVAVLPPAANPLGFMGFDEPEAGLWRPFGSRRIMPITGDDSPAEIRARGVQFALVSERFLNQDLKMKTNDWLVRMDAELLQYFALRLRAGQEAGGWLLIRFH